MEAMLIKKRKEVQNKKRMDNFKQEVLPDIIKNVTIMQGDIYATNALIEDIDREMNEKLMEAKSTYDIMCQNITKRYDKCKEPHLVEFYAQENKLNEYRRTFSKICPHDTSYNCEICGYVRRFYN